MVEPIVLHEKDRAAPLCKLSGESGLAGRHLAAENVQHPRFCHRLVSVERLGSAATLSAVRCIRLFGLGLPLGTDILNMDSERIGDRVDS